MDCDLSLQFLRALTGEQNPVVCFQTFGDKKKGSAQTWHGTLGESQEKIEKLQNENNGVFVTVNRTDGSGRKKENIICLRAVFCDNDTGKQLSYALPPSFCTITARGVNPFWLVKSDTPLAEFEQLQVRLAAHYGTDPSVKDLPRVMRLPGTLHKKGEDMMVGFLPGEGCTYSAAEIVAAHPVSDSTWHDKRVRDVEMKARSRDWTEGNRHTSAVATAKHARAHWVDQAAALAIVAQHANGLPEEEVQKAVDWAYADAPNPEEEPLQVALERLRALPGDIQRQPLIEEMSRRFGIAPGELRNMASADQEIPHHIPWIVVNNVIYPAKYEKDGSKRPDLAHPVATRMITVAAIGKDITSGEDYIKISWEDQHGSVRDKWVSHSAMTSGDMDLPGANISAGRMKSLSSYLSDVSPYAPEHDIEVIGTVGWVDKAWFWAKDSAHYLGPKIPPAGDPEQWKLGMHTLLQQGESGYPALALMCASAGAPLSRVCNKRNPVIGVTHKSSSGKGSSISYALSLWLPPDMLTIPAMSTHKGTEDKSVAFPDLPLFMDEMHLIREDKDVGDRIYFLANGQRRVISSKGMKHLGGDRRHGVGFFASEVPLLDSQYGGVRLRVVSIATKPLKDAHTAAILQAAARQAGALSHRLGSMLSYSLREQTLALSDQLADEHRFTGDDATSFAIMTIGGRLLSRAMGIGDEWVENTMQWLKRHYLDERNAAIGVAEAAFGECMDAVLNAPRTVGGAIMIMDEPVAWLNKTSAIMEINTRHPRLVVILSRYGQEIRTLRQWADAGLIVKTPRGELKYTRAGGGRVVRVDPNVLLSLLNPGTDQLQPST